MWLYPRTILSLSMPFDRISIKRCRSCRPDEPEVVVLFRVELLFCACFENLSNGLAMLLFSSSVKDDTFLGAAGLLCFLAGCCYDW